MKRERNLFGWLKRAREIERGILLFIIRERERERGILLFIKRGQRDRHRHRQKEEFFCLVEEKKVLEKERGILNEKGG